MARITQNLFEEIQKITSGQIEEKKKMHDEDGDGDEDGGETRALFANASRAQGRGVLRRAQ